MDSRRSNQSGEDGTVSGGGDRFMPSRTYFDAQEIHHRVFDPSSPSRRQRGRADRIDYGTALEMSMMAPEDYSGTTAVPSAGVLSPYLRRRDHEGRAGRLRDQIVHPLPASPQPLRDGSAGAHRGYMRLSPLISQSLQKRTTAQRVNDIIQARRGLDVRKTQIKRDAATVLDAPGLVDDFYINILDWSGSSGAGGASSAPIAVALNDVIFLFNPATNHVTQIFNISEYVAQLNRPARLPRVAASSVSFSPDGSVLAVAAQSGLVALLDVVTGAVIETMHGGDGRIPSLSWQPMSWPVFACGAKNGSIIGFDTRNGNEAVFVLPAHSQEVCGLAWRDGGEVLASGGNDNQVVLWDMRRCFNHDVSGDRAPESLMRLSSHRAAVKALTWCPLNMSILATGGGTADGSIILWDTTTGQQLCRAETGAQVCGLVWGAAESQELVSAHGFSRNSAVVWRCNLSEYGATPHGAASVLLPPPAVASGGRSEPWTSLRSDTVDDLGTPAYLRFRDLVESATQDAPVASQRTEQYPQTVEPDQCGEFVLERVAELTGHVSRVLFLAANRDRSHIVTGAGGEDQTLRIWDISSGPGASARGSRFGVAVRDSLEARSRKRTRRHRGDSSPVFSSTGGREGASMSKSASVSEDIGSVDSHPSVGSPRSVSPYVSKPSYFDAEQSRMLKGHTLGHSVTFHTIQESPDGAALLESISLDVAGPDSLRGLSHNERSFLRGI